MNEKEYKQCQTLVRMHKDKIEECKALEARVAALERENKLLKERLGYRRIADASYEKADSECLAIFRNRNAAVSIA